MSTLGHKLFLSLMATFMTLTMTVPAVADSTAPATSEMRVGQTPETPLRLAGFTPVKNPPARQPTEADRQQEKSATPDQSAAAEQSTVDSDTPLETDSNSPQPANDSNTADLDTLMDQFMDTGKAIEGRPGGTDSVGQNWFDALVVTKADNPMLERSCRRDALQKAVDQLAHSHQLNPQQSLHAAREHMHMHQAFINENGISYADYLKTVAECTEFCAPLIASLMQCHILSIGKHPRSIIVFEFNSYQVDQRYTNGMLDAIAERLNTNENLNVLLVGRASKIGGLRYNRRLAGQRALAVSDQLRNKGVDRERIKTMWFGWEPPQIDGNVAQQYGIEGLYKEVGSQGINQSVVVVLYPTTENATVALSSRDG